MDKNSLTTYAWIIITTIIIGILMTVASPFGEMIFNSFDGLIQVQQENSSELFEDAVNSYADLVEEATLEEIGEDDVNNE